MVKNGIKKIQNGLRDSRRQWVPPSLYPDFESLEVPSNALAIRLRAKYWDSLAIPSRTFLQIILERDTSSLSSSCGHPLPCDLPAAFGPDAGSMNPSPNLSSSTNEDVSFAIRTLVESAKTFLGIEYTIVTNVFSSTYIQWGNLLILAACYKDAVLRRKTITLLGGSGTTSALAAKMNILIGVAKDLEFIDDERRTNAAHSLESHW
ncbi:hypothetical protein DL765_009887 [Monosporascus sp. GIB2]|nr:hypothetical protein DL765_009887 [Monosporascus sp. GIB2]